MTKTLSWGAPDLARPFSATLLYLVAAALRSASDTLSRVATARAEAHAAETAFQEAVSSVEFHELYRDSGAPEGALYINGKLVAIIPGVTRL